MANIEQLVAELREVLHEDATISLPGSSEFEEADNRYTQYGRPVSFEACEGA